MASTHAGTVTTLTFATVIDTWTPVRYVQTMMIGGGVQFHGLEPQRAKFWTNAHVSWTPTHTALAIEATALKVEARMRDRRNAVIE